MMHGQNNIKLTTWSPWRWTLWIPVTGNAHCFGRYNWAIHGAQSMQI